MVLLYQHYSREKEVMAMLMVLGQMLILILLLQAKHLVNTFLMLLFLVHLNSMVSVMVIMFTINQNGVNLVITQLIMVLKIIVKSILVDLVVDGDMYLRKMQKVSKWVQTNLSMLFLMVYSVVFSIRKK